MSYVIKSFQCVGLPNNSHSMLVIRVVHICAFIYEAWGFFCHTFSEGSLDVTEDVMVFATGCDAIPILGFDRHPNVNVQWSEYFTYGIHLWSNTIPPFTIWRCWTIQQEHVHGYLMQFWIWPGVSHTHKYTQCVLLHHLSWPGLGRITILSLHLWMLLVVTINFSDMFVLVLMARFEPITILCTTPSSLCDIWLWHITHWSSISIFFHLKFHDFINIIKHWACAPCWTCEEHDVYVVNV